MITKIEVNFQQQKIENHPLSFVLFGEDEVDEVILNEDKPNPEKPDDFKIKEEFDKTNTEYNNYCDLDIPPKKQINKSSFRK